MASASARVRRALSTCMFSIMRPLWVTTPLPSARASSKAAMSARASSIGLGGRRPHVVGRLELARVDERLAVEAELAALQALGLEPVGVLDVVVDAVEDHLAGGPGGEQAQARARAAAAGGRARARRAAPWPGRWCPSRARRGARRRRRSPRRAAWRSASRPSPRSSCGPARRRPRGPSRCGGRRRPSRPWAPPPRRARPRRRPRGRRRATRCRGR